MLQNNAIVIRPFTKVVQLSSNGSTTIYLTDTAGTGILCNYVQARILAPTSSLGFIHIAPTGITTNPQVSLGNGTSGTLGTFGTVLDPAELNLNNGSSCSALFVSGGPNLGDNNISILYGVKQQENSLRGLGKNIGG